MTTLPKQNLATIQRVLGDSYFSFELRHLSFEEDPIAATSKVRVVTRPHAGAEDVTVEGSGVGIVDAMFNGLMARYSGEYESLKTIRLSGFTVGAKLDAQHSNLGADAVGEVTLEVQNSSGRSFRFADASRSIIASGARAVLSAVGYFINSERAFVSLHRALKDAQERKRADLAAQYTRELSELVQSTSYAQVIARLQQQL